MLFCQILIMLQTICFNTYITILKQDLSGLIEALFLLWASKVYLNKLISKLQAGVSMLNTFQRGWKQLKYTVHCSSLCHLFNMGYNSILVTSSGSIAWILYPCSHGQEIDTFSSSLLIYQSFGKPSYSFKGY